jgi:hypothetical protein
MLSNIILLVIIGFSLPINCQKIYCQNDPNGPINISELHPCINDSSLGGCFKCIDKIILEKKLRFRCKMNILDDVICKQKTAELDRCNNRCKWPCVCSENTGSCVQSHNGNICYML